MIHTCALRKVQKNNSSFSEEHFLDYVFENYIHWKWNNMTKHILDDCKNETVSMDTMTYTKPPFNIDREKCFLPYLPFTTCIFMRGFANCEGPLWLKSK